MTPHDTCRCGARKQIVSRLCRSCSNAERAEPVARLARLTESFWSRVEKTETCWLWTGTRDGQGYGRFGSKRVFSSHFAHRIAYILKRGPIPDGLEIDHLCRNPGCVNPDHLEAVTHRVNLLRGTGLAARAARATHCPQGHAYTEENTQRNAQGHRKCRACHRARNRKARV